MNLTTIIALFVTLSVSQLWAQDSYNNQKPDIYTDNLDRKLILYKVNKIRTEGCKCGRTWMRPTNPLTWNKVLNKSSYLHAKEMDRYNFFSHQSRRGLNIGDRLDDLDYKWQFVGENLAEGQKTFSQALTDWLESPSHCKMLMDPKMKEMGMSRVGKYWVHHFGSQMPPKTRRIRTHYREGDNN